MSAVDRGAARAFAILSSCAVYIDEGNTRQHFLEMVTEG
jgi:hypothetical protein